MPLRYKIITTPSHRNHISRRRAPRGSGLLTKDGGYDIMKAGNRILTRIWYGTDMKLIERIFGNFKSVKLPVMLAAVPLTLAYPLVKACRGDFKSRFKYSPFSS